MKKIIAMIPARAGSKRIPKKNIRLIDSKPLIEYIIISAIESNIFSEIYINTDDQVIVDFVSKYYPNLKIYIRNAKFASDSATNDDFMNDFLSNVNCDSVVQLLPTSPFLSSTEIKQFVTYFNENECDTLVSVKKNQIECLMDSKPLNFNTKDHTRPSQELIPIFSYACSIMQWNRNIFLQNFQKNLGAYHGGSGKTEYFELKGFSTIDIDNEEDFEIAEIISKKIKSNTKTTPKYLDSEINFLADANVQRILKSDGVDLNIFNEENKLIASIDDIINKMPSDSSWSYTLINTNSTRATLIAQLPGEGNRRHYHSDWDEWWYILKGSWEFEFNNIKKIVNENEIVLIQRNNIHKITSIGNQLSIRLAVSRDDVDHIYTIEDFNYKK